MCRERAITSNTIMLYSSACTFGQGVIDPIESVSRLGVKYGVGTSHRGICLFHAKHPKPTSSPPFKLSPYGHTSCL